MSSRQFLDELRLEIADSAICPELAAQATRLVMGSGNPDADIVFIGEAPGRNEDLQGEPFVGAAGEDLNGILSLAGLKREDVKISGR